MIFLDWLSAITDHVLFLTCVFILVGSIYISFKLRFVQVRFFPSLWKMLIESLTSKHKDSGKYTIPPHKALFTAMSTTLGISTIVGPVIAIHAGGPGALLGYLLTSFFGSAATYAEVNLSIQYRKRLESGVIMGGPMQYIKQLISPLAAKWYAMCCVVLMTVWSAAQANQLVAVFDSPLLGDWRVPTIISGAITAVVLFVTLIGGIKRVASLSASIVPIMFVLYVTSCLWIVGCNIDKFGDVMRTIFGSVFTPYEMASGVLVGGIVSTMRWGIFKGTQTSEAGVGSQAIPHSMADTKDGDAQGMLAMISTFTSGAISFLSGCVALMTNTWQDPSHPLGMSMVVASFERYFSTMGIVIVSISALLFAFGTILGNSYNGSQCLAYLTRNKGLIYYYLASAIVVFVGTISDAKMVWGYIDIVLAFMIVPHMCALIKYAYSQSRTPEPVLAQSKLIEDDV